MSATVTFQLDGKEVTVPEGTTVMEAAHREGVKIPHFCWHPGLSIAGVCRFCMVHVEGARKPEIACNLKATQGMIVKTDTSEIKETHKWALEYHLINHPLDCPICDQAGECGLQNYYMEVGQYKSQMDRPKVLKQKSMDVGSELVLDTERCILCSRCVRFESEVTKTDALGIFDRGDRSIVGTYHSEKLDHNYQENLVDICPVGAFTSKRFRFKQRVWFLKERESTCPGCSTGCSISVHAKPEMRRYYRVKPSENQDVNKHWMCDKGRYVLDHLNVEHRLSSAMHRVGGKLEVQEISLAVKELGQKIRATQASKIALLVTAQYTVEEYESLFGFFVGDLGVRNVFQWREAKEQAEDFDGILYRGDHNANTAGLMQVLSKFKFEAQAKNQFQEFQKGSFDLVVILAPEMASTFPSLGSDLKSLDSARARHVVCLTLNDQLGEVPQLSQLLPMKGFAEKRGTLVNYAGKAQVLAQPYKSVIEEALDVSQLVTELQRNL